MPDEKSMLARPFTSVWTLEKLMTPPEALNATAISSMGARLESSTVAVTVELFELSDGTEVWDRDRDIEAGVATPGVPPLGGGLAAGVSGPELLQLAKKKPQTALKVELNRNRDKSVSWYILPIKFVDTHGFLAL